MARIRTSGVPTEAKKYMFWGIAAYIRLFKDDGCDESLSVTNQRKIILAFLEDKFYPCFLLLVYCVLFSAFSCLFHPFLW